jgi:polyisoprenoid-binding protein YceI
MKKRTLLALTAAWMLCSSPTQAADNYAFDTSHTKILFMIDHAGFSKFVGEFRQYEGDVSLDLDAPEKGNITIRIMPDGIETGLPDFNEKLKGKEFFNTSEHPVAVFKSTKITMTGKNTADVTGDFTLLGVTKPLTLQMTHNKHGYDKWRKAYKAGFSIRGAFKRSEWGFDTYVPVVGDEVSLLIETEVERPLKDGESY